MPRCASVRATTKPSPPLLPRPHSTPTWLDGEVVERRFHRRDRLTAGVLHQHDRGDADLVDGLRGRLPASAACSARASFRHYPSRVSVSGSTASAHRAGRMPATTTTAPSTSGHASHIQSAGTPTPGLVCRTTATRIQDAARPGRGARRGDAPAVAEHPTHDLPRTARRAPAGARSRAFAGRRRPT